VDYHSEAFVGIDTSRLRNAVAVAEECRGGDVRYLGEIDSTEAATRKLGTLSTAGRSIQCIKSALPQSSGFSRSCHSGH
jgi:hypothetical protein